MNCFQLGLAECELLIEKTCSSWHKAAICLEQHVLFPC